MKRFSPMLRAIISALPFIVLLVLVLVMRPAHADEPTRQANQFGALAAVDCLTTAINIGAGATERNYAPRLFHADSSLLNCGAYMGAQYLGIRLDRNALLRRLNFGWGVSGETYSDVNNIVEMVRSHKNGAKLWHQEPFYMFLRWDKITLF